MTFKKLNLLLLIFLTLISLSVYLANAYEQEKPRRMRFFGRYWLVRLAYAEEDNENEHEEDGVYDRDEDYSRKTAEGTGTANDTNTSISQVDQYLAPQVTQTWVYDVGYDIDTDKDGLVDALDPDPKSDQRLYFTDSDKDGVADMFDKHPEENDFNYVDDTDSNSNGILDSYEQPL